MTEEAWTAQSVQAPQTVTVQRYGMNGTKSARVRRGRAECRSAVASGGDTSCFSERTRACTTLGAGCGGQRPCLGWLEPNRSPLDTPAMDVPDAPYRSGRLASESTDERIDEIQPADCGTRCRL